MEFLDGTESDIDNNGVILRLTMGKVRVYVTSERRTITFTTDGTRLWVETERQIDNLAARVLYLQ